MELEAWEQDAPRRALFAPEPTTSTETPFPLYEGRLKRDPCLGDEDLLV